MREYLGFAPVAVVAGPVAVAAIRQALFYKGCMDGYGYMLVALFAFMCGGALNIVYLLFVGATYRTYFDFANRWQRTVAKAGLAASLLLLAVQAILVAIVAWNNATRP